MSAEERSDRLDEQLMVYPASEHRRLRWRNIALVMWMVGATIFAVVAFAIIRDTQTSNARLLREVDTATSPQAKSDAQAATAQALAGIDCSVAARVRPLIDAGIRRGDINPLDPAVRKCELTPPAGAPPTTSTTIVSRHR